RANAPTRCFDHDCPAPRVLAGGRLSYAGEFAALGTALCFASASNLFASAAGRMGSLTLNRLRITAAWVFLSMTMVLAHHGMIGFIFGDTFQFRSLVILGPGRASLLTATAPLFTTALAWLLLHQVPKPLAFVGMALTISGTAFAFTAPSRPRPDH